MDASDFARVLDDVLPHARFSFTWGTTQYDLERYRRIYVEAIPSHIHSRFACETAKVHLPDLQKKKVVEAVEDVLAQYIRKGDESFIGFGPSLANISGFSLMVERTECFAFGILRMAALTESTTASRQIFAWRDGEKITYTMACVLRGVVVEKPFQLMEGVRFSRLPSDVGHLCDHAPSSLIENMTIEQDLNERRNRTMLGREGDSEFNILGASIMCVDVKIDPPLFHPDQLTPDMRPGKEGIVTTTYAIPGDVLDALYLAISLVCNTYAHSVLSWILTKKCRFLSSSSNGFGRSYDGLLPEASPVPILQSHARDIEQAFSEISKRRKVFDIPARRWLTSRRRDAWDGLIDLRTAIESLYAPRGRGEYRFRIPVNGAWHLGETVDARRKYYNLLREVYDISSGLVHGTEVKKTDEQLRDILDEGRAACRKGILKMIRQGEMELPDTILGRDLEADREADVAAMKELILQFATEMSAMSGEAHDPKAALAGLLDLGSDAASGTGTAPSRAVLKALEEIRDALLQ
ncbi:MAG: hypothetical protein OXH76_15410 [Boseongicola sp.]|nr:hypothetical protein [Boseongicola sp.]